MQPTDNENCNPCALDAGVPYCPDCERTICGYCGNLYRGAKCLVCFPEPNPMRSYYKGRTLCEDCRISTRSKWCPKCGRWFGEIEDRFCAHCGNRYQGKAPYCGKCSEEKAANEAYNEGRKSFGPPLLLPEGEYPSRVVMDAKRESDDPEDSGDQTLARKAFEGRK